MDVVALDCALPTLGYLDVASQEAPPLSFKVICVALSPGLIGEMLLFLKA